MAATAAAAAVVATSHRTSSRRGVSTSLAPRRQLPDYGLGILACLTHLLNTTYL